MSGLLPSDPVMIPTGRDWKPLAAVYILCTAGVGALVFWLAEQGSYAGTSVGMVAPLLMTGFMALLMGCAIASAWYASKSAVWVDLGTQGILVRHGAGLGMANSWADTRDVAAVSVELEEYDTPQPKPRPSLLSIVVVLIFQLSARTRTAYTVVLRRADGRPPLRVLPYRGKTIAEVLPVGKQLAEALGCPLETPDNPTPDIITAPSWQLPPLHPPG